VPSSGSFLGPTSGVSPVRRGAASMGPDDPCKPPGHARKAWLP